MSLTFIINMYYVVLPEQIDKKLQTRTSQNK